MKVVFHVSNDDSEKWERVLGNIPNLIDDPTIDCENIVLVVNSDGIDLVWKGTEYAEKISTLLDRGVDIAACSNTLDKSKRGQEELHPGIETVPSAMGELVRLQSEGYAYVNP